MPEKIPRGVILDLLDLYDLKIQIVYAFFEKDPSISPKLNSYSIEVTKEIYSIAAKWHIEFEGNAPFKDDDDPDVPFHFKFPFHFDGDLITEIAFRSQAIGFNFSGLYPGDGFDWGGLREDEIKLEMHATHRLIKDLLRSERVNANDTERDDAVQDIIIGTKRALSELGTKRNNVSASQPERVTKMKITTMPGKIPRGVILDLSEMYGLEIEILYIVVEYNTQSYKLNYRFKELKDEMFSLLAKWQIPGWEKIEYDDKNRIKGTFYLPFYNHDLTLEYSLRGGVEMLGQYESELDWYPEEILTKMHATHKLIKNLLNSKIVDENETRDENIKDIIEGTRRVLPEVIEEAKRMRIGRANEHQPEHVTKIEVVMPEMRNIEDNGISKGKTRVYPPKFPSTAWPDISIRFINDHDVFITAGAKSAQSNYEALGFSDDKRNMPNRAWKYLLELAQKGGVSDKLPTPIPENIKQTKKQISDRFKIIFDNGTDPFHDPGDSRTYRIKITLIPPEIDSRPVDQLGVDGYLTDTMIDVYEPEDPDR